MNKDEVKGTVDQVKGNVKQRIGKLTGDERMHDEGVADEAFGDVQEGVGKMKAKVGDALKHVGDKIRSSDRGGVSDRARR